MYNVQCTCSTRTYCTCFCAPLSIIWILKFPIIKSSHSFLPRRSIEFKQSHWIKCMQKKKCWSSLSMALKMLPRRSIKPCMKQHSRQAMKNGRNNKIESLFFCFVLFFSLFLHRGLQSLQCRQISAFHFFLFNTFVYLRVHILDINARSDELWQIIQAFTGW